MRTNRSRGRWREGRDTIPAARRRRRHHRRDVQRGASYTPVAVSTEVARDGVRNRLWLGVAALFVTAFCFVAVVAVPQTQFGSAALGTFGFCALNLAVATILSARREEFVHRLAGRLEPPLLEKREGTDGHV